MLAFSGPLDAGTVGAGPVGHWHYRLWSMDVGGARGRFDQPTLAIIPRRRIGKRGLQASRTVDFEAANPANGLLSGCPPFSTCRLFTVSIVHAPVSSAPVP